MHDRPMRAHASKEGPARQQGESVQKIHRTPDSYNDRSVRRGAAVGIAVVTSSVPWGWQWHAREQCVCREMGATTLTDLRCIHELIGSCGRLPSTAATTVDTIRAMNSTHPLHVLSRVRGGPTGYARWATAYPVRQPSIH